MRLFGKKKNNTAAETAGASVDGGRLTAGGEGRAAVAGAALSVKVLGSGCRMCRTLLQNTEKAVSALNLPADIEYVTDMERVAQYGVMSTPALVVGGQVVSMGRVLTPEEVQALLKKTVTTRLERK